MARPEARGNRTRTRVPGADTRAEEKAGVRAGNRPHVAVIGGGIAGLAAAWELTGGDPDTGAQVTVLEADARFGGKLRGAEVAGRRVDVGPDCFVSTRPEALDLCRELGVGDTLVTPGQRHAYLWARGRLRPLPDGLFLGVPTRMGPLLRSGILGPLGAARALAAPFVPGRSRHDDAAVGALVRRSLGAQVAARFADPLVGGIHAGSADTLSAAATFPALLDAAGRGGGLPRALRAVHERHRGTVADPPPSVFVSPSAGMHRLVDSLVGHLVARGVDLRAATPVRGLRRAGAPVEQAGWQIELADGTVLEADAVVVALPTAAAASLLRVVRAPLAELLDQIGHATVAIVTTAFAPGSPARPLDATGFLVPAEQGLLTTACTWLSAKWPHVAPDGTVLLRVSAGRAADTRAAELGDDELAATLLAELRVLMGLRAEPDDVVVTRWPAAFPQYAPGHLDWVRSVEDHAAALGNLALAGAAYGGVGVPACIASGRRAARAVLAGAAEAR